MKHVLNTVFILVTIAFFYSTTIASQILFEDNFNNGLLNGASYVYSPTEFVKTVWEIEDGVFKSGSSSIRADAHWQHYVDIRYFSNYFLTDLSITLDYLNTRDYGGRLSVVLGQVDHSGNIIWANDFRYVDWENWFTGKSRKSLSTNREWKNVSISSEQLLEQSDGRLVNMIFIRELDITNRDGSGYIDNIKISGVLGAHAPEPATLIMLGMGLLMITSFCRRKVSS